MRFVYTIVSILMILFVAVQYNDPDGPFWMVLYGVPAVLAGLAALRPDMLVSMPGRGIVLAVFLCAIALTYLYWPEVPNWWRQDVWWQEETAREGMGLMIATLAVAMLLPAVFSDQPRGFLAR